MKTLHTAYRVRDLERSLDFYVKLGFSEIGRVGIEDGSTLAMLKLPEDHAATLELVYYPHGAAFDIGGFSHIVVQVDDLRSTLDGLAATGVAFEESRLPIGPDEPKTCILLDPDGYRIELVEWPPGHADGITEADFPR